MKNKDQQLPPAAEGPARKPAKRPPDSGSAVDAGPADKRGTVASQTKTTRRLDGAVKRDADDRMAGKQKAVARWEGEGGATRPAKKGGRE